jgi:hypothetical protein
MNPALDGAGVYPQGNIHGDLVKTPGGHSQNRYDSKLLT